MTGELTPDLKVLVDAEVGNGGSQAVSLSAVCRADDEVDVATGGLDPLGNTIGSPGDPGTIDGITLAEGMRVLLLGQGNAAYDDDSEIQNGVWVASEGPWSRADDFAVGTTFQPGTPVVVSTGEQWGEVVVWLMNDDDTSLPFVVGTNQVNFMGNSDLQLFTRLAGGVRGVATGTILLQPTDFDAGGKLIGDIGNTPPVAYSGQFAFDTSATTGGLYAWNGSSYVKVGPATS